MKSRYVGRNPICVERFQTIKGDNFVIPEYHPDCCRWPKSCSSSMYEFTPEDEVELPKRVKVQRLVGIGPGTNFDWMVLGRHPTRPETITLLMYFPTMHAAHRYVEKLRKNGIRMFKPWNIK